MNAVLAVGWFEEGLTISATSADNGLPSFKIATDVNVAGRDKYGVLDSPPIRRRGRRGGAQKRTATPVMT